MAFGLGRLAWPPDDFWAATPREIAAALRAHGAGHGVTPPERGTLERLMAQNPDEFAS
jgi:uncharacterized phage protein (TIGR02216 family)